MLGILPDLGGRGKREEAAPFLLSPSSSSFSIAFFFVSREECKRAQVQRQCGRTDRLPFCCSSSLSLPSKKGGGKRTNVGPFFCS